MSDEKLKRINEIREILEERVRNLEAELEGLKTLLNFVNDLLLEKSFKRAEKPPSPVSARPVEAAPLHPSPSPISEAAKVVPIKTVTGEPLASLCIERGSMRVIPAEDKEFNVNTPPFTSFLVERVLARMQERDKEAVRMGEITSDKAFSFNIVRDGDIIREISIRNISPQREQDLRSTIRWTFEKMYEKITSGQMDEGEEPQSYEQEGR